MVMTKTEEGTPLFWPMGGFLHLPGPRSQHFLRENSGYGDVCHLALPAQMNGLAWVVAPSSWSCAVKASRLLGFAQVRDRVRYRWPHRWIGRIATVTDCSNDRPFGYERSFG